MSALLDLGDLVADMDDTVRILMHLADSRDVQCVSANEWGKLGRDLHDGLRKIKELADAELGRETGHRGGAQGGACCCQSREGSSRQ